MTAGNPSVTGDLSISEGELDPVVSISGEVTAGSPTVRYYLSSYYDGSPYRRNTQFLRGGHHPLKRSGFHDEWIEEEVTSGSPTADGDLTVQSLYVQVLGGSNGGCSFF